MIRRTKAAGAKVAVSTSPSGSPSTRVVTPRAWANEKVVCKSKPWRRDDRVVVINSDVRLLGIFLRFLQSCGIDRGAPSYRLSIHESADAEAAAQWWQAALGIPADRFQRPTLNRHQPKTARYNTGNDYHGCLIINVPRSRELYWRIEGVVAALGRAVAEGVGTADGEALG